MFLCQVRSSNKLKIYKISTSKDDIPNNGIDRVIRAYHGSSERFRKFDPTMNLFWFTEDIDDIKQGTSGAVSNRYIATVDLSVKNTVGWDEYDRYGLQQIENDGFDSIKLDDVWAIFDIDRIKIISWEQFK